MAIRLGRVQLGRRAAWVVPAALGAAATAYLAWGAWVSAHDPRWPSASPVWWRAWLQPADDRTLLAVIAAWVVAWLCYWWPRRLQPSVVTMAAVVSMVLIGGVLSTASLIPCRGGQTDTAVVAWLLGLYLGNAPSVYGQPGTCPGQPPLALQLGEVVCLAATLVGALAAAVVLWRKPVSRLRARAVRDAMVFTGLDPMTMALLQRLARAWRPNRIIVIEPDDKHPMLDEARATGARIMIGDPASSRVLQPVLAGWRGCALSYLYALRPDVGENEAVLAAAHTVLRRYRPHPERQPHLIARIDDVRHADYWRGWRCGTSSHWFEDALSAQEATASALVNEIFRTGARLLLLCGDSTLALAILLELARSYWERRDLASAAALGRAAHPDAAQPAGAGQLSAPLPLEQVVLVDRRAEDLRREYLATSPHLVAGAQANGSAPPGDAAYPGVAAQPVPWKEHLLAMLDAMPPDDTAATAVVIAGSLSEDGMHEAGRVARLHPVVPVFVLTSDGAGTSDAIFDQLRPFQRTLLVDGEALEDTWTRVARHWHECYRLSHPPVPGDPRKLTGRPWQELDDFIRQDNILELRSLMTAVVARGRRWAPRRAVAPGSFIELNDHDLEEVARAEHTRWYRRRVAAGWTAVSDGGGSVTGNTRVNARVRAWEDLPPEIRAANVSHVRSLLAQLESVGFMPVVPEGGPAEAAAFERVGVVRARQLRARRRWTRRSGDELRGDPGDWRVTDGDDERTVQDLQFRASHEPLGGEHWRRTGTYSAWQVREKLVLRTMEGRATAEAGDWVVEGHQGERWPVTDEQFRKTYRTKADE